MEKNPYIRYKNIYVIPTFHSRIEFAKMVRTAFFKVFPDVIAVELPNNIRNEIMEAIKRLPFLSLIGYADSLNPKRLDFIPISPDDSIIEGIRLGMEYNVPVEFIDLSVKGYEPPSVRLPDDYAVNEIGLSLFYEKVSGTFKNEFFSRKQQIRDKIKLEDLLESQKEDNSEEAHEFLEKDVLREKYMASHLLKMMPIYHRILFVVGMAHWESIKYYLESPEKIQDVEIELVPHKYSKIYNIKSSNARFLLKELPYHAYKWVKFRDHYSKDRMEEFEAPDDLFKALDSYDKIDHVNTIVIKAKREYEKEFKEFLDLHKLKALF